MSNRFKKIPTLPDGAVQKSSGGNWEEKADRNSRFGTPPTRRGAFNGSASGLKPAIPAGPNIVVKALGPTTTVRPGAAGPQYGRKRDEHGRFADAQNVGKESGADEDLAQAAREARETQTKINQPRVAKNLGNSLGASPLADANMAPQMNQMDQPVANTMSGMPIYDDPFHPEHNNFGPQEHEEAAQVREGMANNARGMGDQAGAMQHGQAAMAHRDLGNDAMSPMERKMPGMPPAAPPMGQNATPPAPPPPEAPPMDAAPPPEMGMEEDPMGGEEPPMDMGGDEGPPAEEEEDEPFQRGIDDGQPGLGRPQPNQNKPLMPPTGQGPAPGMVHSATQAPVGPQTGQASMFAGSAQQRQPEMNNFSYPPDASNPMPMGGPSGLDALRKLSGMATEQEDPAQMQGMVPPMQPNNTSGDSAMNVLRNKNMAPAFKSLSDWRSKRK